MSRGKKKTPFFSYKIYQKIKLKMLILSKATLKDKKNNNCWRVKKYIKGNIYKKNKRVGWQAVGNKCEKKLEIRATTKTAKNKLHVVKIRSIR